MPTQMTDEQFKAGRHVLLRHPLNDRMAQHFLIQRLVYPSTGHVVQLAVVLFAPPHANPALHPDGYPLGDSGAAIGTPGGQRIVAIHSPRSLPAVAGLNERLRSVAYREITGDDKPDPEFDPDVAMLAVKDDRVCGYATGGRVTTNLVRIESAAQGVLAERTTIIPAMEGMRVPCADMVWVAAGHRRAGLAAILLRHLAAALESEPRQIAYLLPFTQGGLRLVQRFVGLQFLAAADEVLALSLPLADEEQLSPCHTRKVVTEQTVGEAEAAIHRFEQLGLRPMPFRATRQIESAEPSADS